jgi:hypothetical protein
MGSTGRGRSKRNQLLDQPAVHGASSNTISRWNPGVGAASGVASEVIEGASGRVLHNPLIGSGLYQLHQIGDER